MWCLHVHAVVLKMLMLESDLDLLRLINGFGTVSGVVIGFLVLLLVLDEAVSSSSFSNACTTTGSSDILTN